MDARYSLGLALRLNQNSDCALDIVEIKSSKAN
jgi:hypothetical protein